MVRSSVPCVPFLWARKTHVCYRSLPTSSAPLRPSRRTARTPTVRAVNRPRTRTTAVLPAAAAALREYRRSYYASQWPLTESVFSQLPVQARRVQVLNMNAVRRVRCRDREVSMLLSCIITNENVSILNNIAFHIFLYDQALCAGVYVLYTQLS